MGYSPDPYSHKENVINNIVSKLDALSKEALSDIYKRVQEEIARAKEEERLMTDYISFLLALEVALCKAGNPQMSGLTVRMLKKFPDSVRNKKEYDQRLTRVTSYVYADLLAGVLKISAEDIEHMLLSFIS